MWGSVHLAKLVFAHTAERANPIGRQFFKRGSRGYAAIRIALFRIVNVSACIALIFIHHSTSVIFAGLGKPEPFLDVPAAMYIRPYTSHSSKRNVRLAHSR